VRCCARNSLQNQKNPGSFTIPWIDGDVQFDKKKLDLGSNIHIHSIGELKSTFVSLQVADRSVTYPKGIIEDMLIKVKQYVLPAGFVVLDMKEDYNISC